MSDFNSEDLSKFSEELLRLTQNGVSPLGASASTSTGHLNNFSDALKKAEILKDFVKNVASVNDALGELADASKDAIEKSDKSTEEEKKAKSKAIKQFGKDLLTASGSVLSAASDAATGTGKYSKSLEQVGISADKLGKEWGKVGEALGWGSEKLMQYAAASLKQNDALMGAYQTLGKFGQLNTSNLKDVLSDVHDAGFRVQTAAQYVAIVTSASQDLALLGKSAGEGRTILNDVFQGTLNGEVKEQLMRFGMTAEEMFEKSAGFLQSIAVSTNLNKTDTTALHNLQVEYLKTYSELSELTGKNRDEMAKSRRSQEEDTAFQLFLEELSGQGKSGMQKAETYRTIIDQMPQKDRVGMMQYFRSGGQITGQESGAALQKFGIRSMRGLRNVAETDYGDDHDRKMKAIVDGLANTAQSTRRTLNLVGKTMRYSGSDDPTRAAFGIDTDTLRFTKRYETKTGAEALNTIQNIKNKPTESDRVGLYAKQDDNERKIQQAQDAMVYSMGDIAVPTVTAFTTGIAKATDALTAFTDTMGMSNNWNKSFKSLETLSDVSDELIKEQKKQVELQRKIDENDAKILAAEKDIAELQPDAAKGGWWANKKLGWAQERLTKAQEAKASSSTEMQRSSHNTDRALNAGQRIQTIGSGQGNPLEGLKTKEGVGAGGKYLDPKLVTLMNQVQSQIPGFSHITSTNEPYNRKPGSFHPLGKAFDFKLTQPPTRQEGEAILKLLDEMGLKGIDEYNNPTTLPDGTLAKPHIHAQLKARTGGVFSGPESGYKVELHGKEAIVPMNSSQGFKQLGNLASQDPSKGVTKHALSRGMADSGSTSYGSPLLENLMRQLTSMMATKMDDLIAEIQTSNEYQTTIAKAAKKK